MIRKLASWLVVLGLVFYIAYQPASASNQLTSIGGSVVGVFDAASGFLAGFADRLDSAQPDQTPKPAP